MKPHTIKTAGAWLALLLSIATVPSLCAEEEIKEMIQGSAYLAARYIGIGVNETKATVYDPGIFEGTTTIQIDQGSGFALAAGLLRENEHSFGGVELEWMVVSSDLVSDVPSLANYNSYEQMSFNLNFIAGWKPHQRLRPYLIGGIGYTEVEILSSSGGWPAPTMQDLEYADTFGFHAGVGIDVQVYKGLHLDAGYRYYQTTDPKFEGRDKWVEIENSGYILHIGLTYNHLFPPAEKRSFKEIWRESRSTGK